MTGGSGASGTLTFVHVAYERFLDMKRLQRGGKSVKSNRKIHNRYVFGAFASIAERLMYEFTEDVIARIRSRNWGERSENQAGSLDYLAQSLFLCKHIRNTNAIRRHL